MIGSCFESVARIRVAITAPAARSSSRASAGERWASSSMRGPRKAQTTHGVSVVSLRRASGAVLQPSDSLALAVGDTLVLSGLPEHLARAEEALLRAGRSGAGLAAPDPR